MNNDLGVPKFGRIEISMKDRKTVKTAADRLRALAMSLDKILAEHDDDATAILVAYRKIRAISDMTRKGN